MAANFSQKATWVYPEAPVFHTIITPSENQKKSFLNLSGSTPICRYKLVFDGMSDTNFWSLHKHYYTGASGGANVFTWDSVPSYIDTNFDGTPDGNNMDGRWVEGSFKFETQPNSWKAEIIFEKNIT